MWWPCLGLSLWLLNNTHTWQDNSINLCFAKSDPCISEDHVAQREGGFTYFTLSRVTNTCTLHTNVSLWLHLVPLVTLCECVWTWLRQFTMCHRFYKLARPSKFTLFQQSPCCTVSSPSLPPHWKSECQYGQSNSYLISLHVGITGQRAACETALCIISIITETVIATSADNQNKIYFPAVDCFPNNSLILRNMNMFFKQLLIWQNVPSSFQMLNVV